MNQLYHEIGQRFAEIRHANNLTQYQMSEILDISVKHCSCVERGESTLSLEKMIYLCDTFGVNLDYLVRGKKAPGETAPVIPKEVVEIMSSDDEKKKEIFLQYLEIFEAMSKND